ncbi:MAG: molecular chaperone DnaK, partial [Pseudomonadota bacterium]
QAERIINEVEELFPRVESIIADSVFGQDAVKKARITLERAKSSVESRDQQAILESREALSRTLNMFKGVVSKAQNK